MTAQVRKRASKSTLCAAKKPAGAAPPMTLDEYVYRIEALGKRIDVYLRFMGRIVEHTGLSDEMKTRAIIAFYEKLIIAEQQLGRIHDEFSLQ
jgi:hypothetical protein